MRCIHVYTYLLALTTLLLSARTYMTPRARWLRAYATLVAGLHTLALYVRWHQHDWVHFLRMMDLICAQGTLGLCMYMLYRYIRTLDATATTRLPASWASYMRLSALGWIAMLPTVYIRPLYTLMYLLLCLQWVLYHAQLSRVWTHYSHRLEAEPGLLAWAMSCLGGPPRAKASRSAAAAPTSVHITYDLLNVYMLMCLQLMFLVIYSYAEELRDFHVWIVITSRTFSVVFFLLLGAPHTLALFDIPPASMTHQSA